MSLEFDVITATNPFIVPYPVRSEKNLQKRIPVHRSGFATIPSNEKKQNYQVFLSLNKSFRAEKCRVHLLDVITATLITCILLVVHGTYLMVHYS